MREISLAALVAHSGLPDGSDNSDSTNTEASDKHPAHEKEWDVPALEKEAESSLNIDATLISSSQSESGTGKARYVS